MTQEHKEILLKDLCSRLPYGVKMNHIADDECSPKTLIGIAKDMITLQGLGGYECVDVEHYKPYLFPLSSMIEEQKNAAPFESSLLNAFINGYISLFEDEELTIDDLNRLYNWLNKNHFDYRGLIPMGLAIDATGLNIY